LSEEFGDKLPLFSTLTKLFVPRTKAMLQLMAGQDEPLMVDEFNGLAKRIGIAGKSLPATLQVLSQSGCVAMVQDGKIDIQDLGQQFLHFEKRLDQLYKG
jgi:predicted transcriptional regulator